MIHLPLKTKTCLMAAAMYAVIEDTPEVLDHLLDTPGFPLEPTVFNMLVEENPSTACLEQIQTREWKRRVSA